MLHRLVLVYTCKNATLLEIICHGSIVDEFHRHSHQQLSFFIHQYVQWGHGKFTNSGGGNPLKRVSDGMIESASMDIKNELKRGKKL